MAGGVDDDGGDSDGGDYDDDDEDGLKKKDQTCTPHLHPADPPAPA